MLWNTLKLMHDSVQIFLCKYLYTNTRKKKKDTTCMIFVLKSMSVPRECNTYETICLYFQKSDDKLSNEKSSYGQWMVTDSV